MLTFYIHSAVTRCVFEPRCLNEFGFYTDMYGNYNLLLHQIRLTWPYKLLPSHVKINYIIHVVLYLIINVVYGCIIAIICMYDIVGE